jgi:hypothetical protein
MHCDIDPTHVEFDNLAEVADIDNLLAFKAPTRSPRWWSLVCILLHDPSARYQTNADDALLRQERRLTRA